MNFEWDKKKRSFNIEKHAIDFVDAALILSREPLVMEDSRRDCGEPRYLAFGFLRDMLLVVMFTVRGDAFRLISARRANARERRMYEAHQKAGHHEYDS